MDEPKTFIEASRGDAGAVDELLQHHLPGLRAFIRLRMGPVLRDRESCSDLAQSVCREVLEHLGRFQYPGEKAFKHWLFTEALRKISNRAEFYRAAKRDAAREVRAGGSTEDRSSDGGLSQIYHTVLTPSRELMAREHVERLERAFDRLPDDYREVITLSRVVGLSRAEIAREMGKSEASVRNLLHRGLSRLAELLEQGTS